MLPNVSPLDYELGRCRDRHGHPGIALYAVRTINAGEEVHACFATMNASREYATSCSHHNLLRRWSGMQRTLLAPYLRAW